MREVEIIPYGGRLFYTSSRSKFRKFYKKITSQTCEKITSQGLTHWCSSGPDQLWMVYAKDTPTLAHELMHVVMFVCKHVGIDPREANGEPAAYLLGYLMEQCGEH